MCPRACAFGPRTSPSTRSSAPSSRCSQSTSTMAGSSDTPEELSQEPVELVGPFEVHEVTGVGKLLKLELGQFSRCDERLVLADDEGQRARKVARDLRRVLTVADCLESTDEPVGISVHQRRVAVAGVREQLRLHEPP